MPNDVSRPTVTLVPRRLGPPIPLGRPSQNLGSIFNSQLNNQMNLPINIFESNPLPFRGPVNSIVSISNRAIPEAAKNAVSFRQRFLAPLSNFGQIVRNTPKPETGNFGQTVSGMAQDRNAARLEIANKPRGPYGT